MENKPVLVARITSRYYWNIVGQGTSKLIVRPVCYTGTKKTTDRHLYAYLRNGKYNAWRSDDRKRFKQEQEKRTSKINMLLELCSLTTLIIKENLYEEMVKNINKVGVW